ncbi:MAG: mechanosensitive ion channel [Symploca sp. SIO3C6]|nr:mechanosensitive ion channel [Symploca sp. SIO3C6]
MDYLLEVIGVDISLPDPITVAMALLLSLIFFLTFLLVTGLSYLQLPKLIDSLFTQFSSTEFREIYQKVMTPHQGWLSWVIILTIVDLTVLVIPAPTLLKFLELPLGLLVAINIIFLSFKLFIELFERYLIEVMLEEDRKINSELLALAKFLTKAVIVLTVVFLFAQTHQINIFGLVASLGIGGITIAFASQKVLEQILWSIVLYIDRPFTVDDYIHLPDGTLGRVESIGWRSTKVRLSGKNTLVIVPNSNLAQVNIENLTGASRVILMVNLTFLRSMSDEEKALIEQLILGSTREILGIDHQLTKITFHDLNEETGSNHVQAQVVFFILGAAQTSMELRRNLLEIARASIIERLHDYGITFKFEEKIIDIAQPMNI